MNGFDQVRSPSFPSKDFEMSDTITVGFDAEVVCTVQSWLECQEDAIFASSVTNVQSIKF